jgi:hypothetical protein
MSARTRSRISTTSGIIRIGAEVRPGDILIGKITPKGETQLSPEEKLLRAIFGEKAARCRDTSLKVPPGVEGTVINARVFSRKGVSKDERSRLIEEEETAKLKKDQEDEQRIIRESTLKHLKRLFVGKEAAGRVSDDQRRVVPRQGQGHRGDDFDEIPRSLWGEIKVNDPKIEEETTRLVEAMQEQLSLIRLAFTEKLDRLKAGDELPPGVIKMVKVFVAIKRKLQVGDKMAGRHGNKGVLSRILPEEDMPYLEDGTPVEVVLNPLGVPSRMNLGQILETHLGWAARALGAQLAGEAAQNGKTNAAALRKKMSDLYGKDYGRLSTTYATRTSSVCRGRPRRRAYRVAGVRRRLRGRGLRVAAEGGAAQHRSDAPLRRSQRRRVRPRGDRRHHVHAEAAPLGGRQDPRPLDRSVLAGHPAATGRQGAVRRSASRRNGGVGTGGVWRRLQPPGDVDGEVGRRGRSYPYVRSHRQR